MAKKPEAEVQEQPDQEQSLAEKVVAARKVAEAAMPLGHGVQHGSEIRGALILIAQVHAITGGDEPDFSVAPEYVPPPQDDQSDDAAESSSKKSDEPEE
jgi:hypothetical protein